MNMRQKYIAFISAFICSSIIMAVAGGVILGFQRPPKTKTDAVLYTVPPPEDGCCFVSLESNGQLLGYFGIYFEYDLQKAYLTWAPADFSLPDSALYTFLDIGTFSRLVDNCNGVIYTESGKSHTILGEDICQAILSSHDSRAAAYTAAFFCKMLQAEFIDDFEKRFTDFLDERGNISIVHWLQRKEVLKGIGSKGKIIGIPHQTFSTLFYKE